MTAGEVLRFGSFELDAARRRLSRGDGDVHLTPKAFDLLRLLVDEAPRVIAKSEIHDRIWPGTFVTDATLVGVVKELRRALAGGGGSSPIRTVHRIGYALAVPVTRHRQASTRPVEAVHWLVADGRRLPLHEGVNTIGRDPDSDVFLNFSSVSRHHARIVIERDRTRLEDAGSKNGTRVGDAVVLEPVTIKDGDLLYLGTVRVSYRTASPSVSTETRASAVDIPSAAVRELKQGGTRGV